MERYAVSNVHAGKALVALLHDNLPDSRKGAAGQLERRHGYMPQIRKALDEQIHGTSSRRELPARSKV
jgi:hypothetical protein